MKSLNKILQISVLFLMAACTSKSPSDQIDSMQERLNVAENRVEVLYNQDFSNLVGRCLELDTIMDKTIENVEAQELIEMYLQQFETVRPIMEDNINYSRQQLSNLKDDIVNGILDDEKINKYLNDEEAALHKIETQVNYFQEKFDEQAKVAKELAK